MKKDKETSSQEDIGIMIACQLLGCVRQISEMQDKGEVTEECLTIKVCEVGLGGMQFDMTIALTPKGVFNDFVIAQHKEVKNPFFPFKN